MALWTLRQRILLFVCRRHTVSFDKMQLFGLPNAAKDLKNKKNILKRNLTLCIVFAMYIAPEVLE